MAEERKDKDKDKLFGLLVIDLQRDFFNPNGPLKSSLNSNPIINSLETLVPTFRQNKYPIFWIKSDYRWPSKPPPKHHPKLERRDNKPMNDDFLASGHFSKKNIICHGNSKGSKFIQPIRKFIHPGDRMIIKTYYSAFTNTPLLDQLIADDITDLVVLGVQTNVCVLATVCDAFHSGFKIHVMSDGVQTSKPDYHTSALHKISTYYGDVMRSYVFYTKYFNHKLMVKSWEFNDSFLVDNIFDEDEVEFYDVFEKVREEVNWQHMFNREKPVPRLVSIMGNKELVEDKKNNHLMITEPVYRHPADTQPTMVSFSSSINKIRLRVQEITGNKINHCLAQYYRRGRDNIGEHSDKTLDIDPNSLIINVSLGATRKMTLRSKKSNDGDNNNQRKKIEVELHHSSMFCLGLDTNKILYHSIREDRRQDLDKRWDEKVEDGGRISLTFRTISTFRTKIVDLKDYSEKTVLWGQGSPYKTLEEASNSIDDKIDIDDQLDMLKAFSRENHQSDFDWKLNYGEGFHSLNFRELSSS